MIYLITGVPGSGKTLYAVSTLVQKLAAEKVTGKDGVERNRRVIIDGINDLVIDHELMAVRKEVDLTVAARGVKSKEEDETQQGNGLWNWFEWCQPGDILVVDEVQRYWRPRGMGTKPPPEIAMLETHRHLGVDFVIITQNPMLIDQNVRRLVGRHQNIRRMLGMQRAIIYDWDGCAADVTRTKGATSSMWSYPKSAYALYKSAELHTKQRHKIPLWLGVPLLAVVMGIFVAPKAFSTMSGAMTGKGIQSSSGASSSSVGAAAAYPSTVAVAVPSGAASAPSAAASSPVPVMPVVAGCVASKKRCACYDSTAVLVEVGAAMCSGMVASSSVVPKVQIDAFLSRVSDIRGVSVSLEQSAADASVLAFMAGR